MAESTRTDRRVRCQQSPSGNRGSNDSSGRSLTGNSKPQIVRRSRKSDRLAPASSSSGKIDWDAIEDEVASSAKAEPTVDVSCPHCGYSRHASTRLAGRRVLCPRCRARFQVPKPLQQPESILPKTFDPHTPIYEKGPQLRVLRGDESAQWDTTARGLRWLHRAVLLEFCGKLTLFAMFSTVLILLLLIPAGRLGHAEAWLMKTFAIAIGIAMTFVVGKAAAMLAIDAFDNWQSTVFGGLALLSMGGLMANNPQVGIQLVAVVGTLCLLAATVTWIGGLLFCVTAPTADGNRLRAVTALATQILVLGGFLWVPFNSSGDPANGLIRVLAIGAASWIAVGCLLGMFVGFAKTFNAVELRSHIVYFAIFVVVAALVFGLLVSNSLTSSRLDLSSVVFVGAALMLIDVLRVVVQMKLLQEIHDTIDCCLR